MIITTSDEWTALYNSIKQDSTRSDEKHVFIYACASDADSVCALRILERLFKNDRIPHGWMAVSRYEEIEQDFKQTYQEGEEALRTAILINCGAAEDVRQLLHLEQRSNVRVIIIDSHRPICHLNNLDSEEDNIIVFLDEMEGTAKDDIPPWDDAEVSSGSDDENDSPSKQRRLSSPGGGSASGGGGGVRQERRKERAQREAFREAYYAQGVSYGKPAACLLFDLAYHLGQENANMLWLALVGLTDHLVHGRLAADKYLEYYLHYETYVASAGHLDVQAEREVLDGEGATMLNNQITCRILPVDDYRFGLLWQWNLYESMLYSPYVAARLQTYTEKGRTLLELLLAKLGIPLEEAQRSFAGEGYDMAPRYRHSLSDKLETHAPAFRMGDVAFKSFQLQDGLRRCVNAVDLVYAVTALLECGSKKGPAAHFGDHTDKFWRAYHALSWGSDGGELRAGLDMAKKVQRALVNDGGAVLQQHHYHNFKQFRIYDLSDHKMNAQHLIGHPMALQRLAAFFQEQHFQARGKRKPVILIGPKAENGRCLVIGYEATQRMRGNKLGTAFIEATDRVGAQAWHDLFDTCVFEIKHDDVARFKEELLRLANALLQ
ncbi:cell division control 45-like protein [Micractinium conductrix]|uniref:Cell division control 45-like protein n=1 Tax=Micractinium conductrix TaxID=554055 RepID=A0A2P6VBL0_9CHLO|nr:cell division control 45-like protein [Micractinium conductrix]|eukprot:PSC71473.1 cell division control 45-like protein [Micractinium conductrix]